MNKLFVKISINYPCPLERFLLKNKLRLCSETMKHNNTLITIDSFSVKEIANEIHSLFSSAYGFYASENLAFSAKTLKAKGRGHLS